MQTQSEELERLYTPAEISEAFHVSLNTLRAWRVRHRAGRARVPLRFFKSGGKVLYRLSDVQEFIASRTFTPGEPRPRRKRQAA
jgi:hypothetical protein